MCMCPHNATLGVLGTQRGPVLLQGVVYAGRPDLSPDNYLTEVAIQTDKRTLKEAVEGADVFLGLSVSTAGPAGLGGTATSASCCNAAGAAPGADPATTSVT